MKINHEAVTQTVLFRLAAAVLPEATILALFGRRVAATMAPTREQVRRAVAARRWRR